MSDGELIARAIITQLVMHNDAWESMDTELVAELTRRAEERKRA